MSGYGARLDDADLRRWLEKLPKEIEKSVIDAVDKTTLYGLRVVKEEAIPKRSGKLRKTYTHRKTGKFSREIYSNSQYADALEFGSRAKTIRPRRAKMLTIPLRDSVLTTSKAQISKPALDRLFSALKSKGKKKASQVYQEVGIALAKKADIPAIPGQFNLARKAMPKIDDYYLNAIMTAIRGAIS